jgi:hypothetical protein
MAHLDANATGEIDSGSPLGEREMNTFDWARLVAAELDDRVYVVQSIMWFIYLIQRNSRM